MRAEFTREMTKLFQLQPNMVFITLDLGYMAVENIEKTLGERFLNAGVAEQNAMSLAAGLAQQGQLPWVYSMAVFAILRPYAQIRDNICLHKLPVKIVGNGGGYGYGIMGATHHALEDVGAMRALPHLRIYLPLLNDDIPQVITMMAADPLPNYLRLNTPAKIPGTVARFAPWRKLKSGRSCVVIGMGPVLQNLYEMNQPALFEELEIWNVGMLPLETIPAELALSIKEKGQVVTMEEHYGSTGLGEALSHLFLKSSVVPTSFTSLHASGYPSGRYGSQHFHQEENSLRGPTLIARLEQLLRE